MNPGLRGAEDSPSTPQSARPHSPALFPCCRYVTSYSTKDSPTLKATTLRKRIFYLKAELCGKQKFYSGNAVGGT